MQLPSSKPARKPRKMLLVAVSLASGVTLECGEAAGIGLFDSGLGCEPVVSFDSYCGFASVATTCNVPISCADAGFSNGFGTITTCTLPIPARSCTITATLPDGTQHTLPVTVESSSSACAGIWGVALPLECVDSGLGVDAGALDASDATIDVADGTTSDVEIDAISD